MEYVLGTVFIRTSHYLTLFLSSERSWHLLL